MKNELVAILEYWNAVQQVVNESYFEFYFSDPSDTYQTFWNRVLSVPINYFYLLASITFSNYFVCDRLKCTESVHILRINRQRLISGYESCHRMLKKLFITELYACCHIYFLYARNHLKGFILSFYNTQEWTW